MSEIECGRCGRMTNTALCDWVNCMDTGKAARCYAAWDEENRRWVAGCAMNDGDADSHNFAAKIINNQKDKE